MNILLLKISIEDFNRAMSYLMTGIRLNMFLDYYIENWVIIMDINFMSVFGIPFKVIVSTKLLLLRCLVKYLI